MNKNTFLTLLVLGLVVVAIGLRFNIKPLVSLTFFGLGLYGLVSGVKMIITRRAFVPMSSKTNPQVHRPAENHTGFSAQLWGVLFIVFGILAAGIGVAVWFPSGILEAGFSRLLDTSAGWGILILALGIPVIIYGLTRLLASASAFTHTAYKNPIKRFINGFYYSLIGLVLVGIGYLLITSPALLKDMAAQFLGFILTLASQ